MDQLIYTSSTRYSLIIFSLSSSSSSSSRKGSIEAACFDLGIHEKKQKKGKRSAHRSLSIGLDSVTEETQDQEEFLITRFHRIRMPNDKLEFRETIPSRLRERQPRRASLSPHGTNGLPRVEEVRGDDDDDKNKCIFKLGLIIDKDEFNDKKGRNHPLYERPVLDGQNLPILEDAQENDREKVQHQSPSYKLKVDEMDFNQDKKQWTTETVIEVIEEEKPEFDANAKAKEMFQQIKKLLVEDRQFLKKIVKGELMQEEDLIKKEQFQTQFGEYHWNLLIQEAEENVQSSGSEEDQ